MTASVPSISGICMSLIITAKPASDRRRSSATSGLLSVCTS